MSTEAIDQSTNQANNANPQSALGSNVDAAEIAKFEALAHLWWDENSQFKPLHDINPLRCNYIDERSPLSGKKVIDIGCGGGILAEAMAKRGASVTGIDMGREPLEVAKLHQVESNLNIDYQQITAEEIADREPEQYDIVTCLEMLEHVPEPSSVIQACAKLCKPGGHIYFATINRNPKAFAFAIVGAEYLLNMLPKGTHEYAKFIRPAELADWARDAGLIPQDVTGMSYNPIFKSYKFGSDVGVNYITHMSKPA